MVEDPQALERFERDSGLRNLRIEPAFDPLRDDPRFQAIERAVGFPDLKNS